MFLGQQESRITAKLQGCFRTYDQVHGWWDYNPGVYTPVAPSGSMGRWGWLQDGSQVKLDPSAWWVGAPFGQ